MVGLATVSVGAMLLGATLMNFMSYYVAGLAKAGVPPWAVILLGWQPWAISRVVAFATLGVLLAEPLVAVVFPTAKEKLRSSTRAAYVVAAMSGILADWCLKFLLGPRGAGGCGPSCPEGGGRLRDAARRRRVVP